MTVEGLYRGSKYCEAKPATGLRLLSLDSLALVAVFLQITELYRPLGYLAGFETSRQVNAAFAGFFVFYLLVCIRTLAQLHSGIIAGWVFTLGVAPLLVMSVQRLYGTVTTERWIYWSAFSALFVLLLLTVVVLWVRIGPGLSVPFFMACIGATWVGFAVNLLNPDFMRDILTYGSNPIGKSLLSSGRILGFYSHPNEAGVSLVLYFSSLASAPMFLASRIAIQVLASVGCLAGVLVTGSRGSLLLLGIAFVWYLKNLMKMYSDIPAWNRGRSLIVPLIPVMVLPVSFLLIQLVADVGENTVITLVSRFLSIFDLSQGVDQSATVRVAMLFRYYADLSSSPWLGYGPDFVAGNLANGSYVNVSQNAWLEWSVKSGVPYACLVFLMLFASYRFTVKLSNPQYLPRTYTRLIFTILALLTFSMVDIFWIRSVVGTLGVLLGVSLHKGQNAGDEWGIGWPKGPHIRLPVDFEIFPR